MEINILLNERKKKRKKKRKASSFLTFFLSSISASTSSSTVSMAQGLKEDSSTWSTLSAASSNTLNNFLSQQFLY
jgi:hypothetical protein